MYSFTDKAVATLYSRKFLLLSSAFNLILYTFTIRIVPQNTPLMLVCSAVMMTLLLEGCLRKAFSVTQYNSRYALTMITGIMVITASLFRASKDYILFVPFVTSFVYLNANAIIKSRLLHWLILAFMITPVIKMVTWHFNLEAAMIMAFYASINLIAIYLFSTNKQAIDEAKNEGAYAREMMRLLNAWTVHDVRNELTKMQILAKKDLRSDLPKFLDTLYQYTESIAGLVDNDVEKDLETIHIRDMVARLTHVTNHAMLDFHYLEDDNSPVTGKRRIVYSVLKNIIENSLEAALRNGRKAHIELRKAGNSVVITDDCGGFDIERIRFGYSSKGESSHGFFLRTITNPATENVFGFKTTLTNTGIGTKITLTFKDAEARPALIADPLATPTA